MFAALHRKVSEPATQHSSDSLFTPFVLVHVGNAAAQCDFLHHPFVLGLLLVGSEHAGDRGCSCAAFALARHPKAPRCRAAA